MFNSRSIRHNHSLHVNHFNVVIAVRTPPGVDFSFNVDSEVRKVVVVVVFVSAVDNQVIMAISVVWFCDAAVRSNNTRSGRKYSATTLHAQHLRHSTTSLAVQAQHYKPSTSRPTTFTYS